MAGLVPERFSMLGIIRGLMLADNLGDVHDEINYLHDLIGLPRPEGDFVSGWTDEDMNRLKQV
jgi:hypothetical protein